MSALVLPIAAFGGYQISLVQKPLGARIGRGESVQFLSRNGRSGSPKTQAILCLFNGNVEGDLGWSQTQPIRAHPARFRFNTLEALTLQCIQVSSDISAYVPTSLPRPT